MELQVHPRSKSDVASEDEQLPPLCSTEDGLLHPEVSGAAEMFL